MEFQSELVTTSTGMPFNITFIDKRHLLGTLRCLIVGVGISRGYEFPKFLQNGGHNEVIHGVISDQAHRMGNKMAG